MKQKKMLSLTLSQIRQLYCQELPELTAMAQQSLDDTDFKNHLQEFLTPYISGGNKAGEQIRLLISYDGKTVHELSNEQDMQIQTLSLLRRFLTGNLENAEIPTDLFLDLYYLFKRLEEPESPLPSPQRIKNRTERWATGLDEDVIELRSENQERMLHLLIQKIENRKSKPCICCHGPAKKECLFLPLLTIFLYSIPVEKGITMKPSAATFFTPPVW